MKETREMGKVVKLGWMRMDVIGKDEKVEREKGEIFVRCRNENQKREN